MKLISLNIWGGKIYQPLMEFIKKQSETTDIFCFQEALQSSSQVLESSGYKTNILNDLKVILKDFQGYFAKTFSGYDMVKLVDFDLHFGIAIFVKKSIEVVSYEETFIHQVIGGMSKKQGFFETSRSLQFVQFQFNNKTFNVYNLHGIWVPDAYGGKKDSKERILQSKKIKQFMQKHIGEKIVTGDFNLNPGTKSLKIIENHFTNLVKKYSIPTTRSNLYKGPYKFADYILVSSGVGIIDFQVPNVSVSDHLPMILKFT